jgi:hypothetical protein
MAAGISVVNQTWLGWDITELPLARDVIIPEPGTKHIVSAMRRVDGCARSTSSATERLKALDVGTITVRFGALPAVQMAIKLSMDTAGGVRLATATTNAGACVAVPIKRQALQQRSAKRAARPPLRGQATRAGAFFQWVITIDHVGATPAPGEEQEFTTAETNDATVVGAGAVHLQVCGATANQRVDKRVPE